MFAFALLAACAVWQAPATGFAAAALAGPGCTSSTTFVGFSDNGEVAAEQVVVTCHPSDDSEQARGGLAAGPGGQSRTNAKGPPRAGACDRLTYVRVYRVARGEPVAVFRSEVPTRTRKGREVAVAPAAWAARYPAYRRALPPAAWRRLARQAHFASKAVAFSSDVVRLAPIGGGLCHAHPAGNAAELESCGAEMLAFDVVVRTLGGALEKVLNIRAPATRGKLRLYFDHSGRRFAALLDLPGRADQLVLATEPIPDPIDLSDQLGVVPVMRWDAQRALNDLSDILPSSDPRARELAKEAFRM